jgi:hypothetical protein
MIAAAVGSLLTLRTLVDSSPTARAFSVVSAFCVSFSGTPALVEWVGATHKQERIMALLVAFLGVNLLAGLATFAEKWRQDPQAAAAWLFSLWRGGPASTAALVRRRGDNHFVFQMRPLAFDPNRTWRGQPTIFSPAPLYGFMGLRDRPHDPAANGYQLIRTPAVSACALSEPEMLPS